MLASPGLAAWSLTTRPRVVAVRGRHRTYSASWRVTGDSCLFFFFPMKSCQSSDLAFFFLIFILFNIFLAARKNHNASNCWAIYTPGQISQQASHLPRLKWKTSCGTTEASIHDANALHAYNEFWVWVDLNDFSVVISNLYYTIPQYLLSTALRLEDAFLPFQNLMAHWPHFLRSITPASHNAKSVPC